MRNYQDIVTILYLVADYYQSIKLELEKGGFGGDVFEAESNLFNYIAGNTEGYRCDWASNNHLTQKVADVADGCYNFMTANEDNLYKKSSHYLAIIMFLDQCLNDIELTTGIEPQLGEPAPASQEPATGRELPSELDTEQARKYFARAVAAGLMSEQFEWLASQSLLACFCREMSVNLGLGKGYSSEGQKRLSWKPFEALFNVKAKNLTTSLNDIKKTGQDPIGIEKVEAIFKD